MTKREQDKRHAERMAIIMRPFPVVLVHTGVRKVWAGMIIGENFFGDEDGKRMLRKGVEGYDESYIRYGAEDDRDPTPLA